MTTAESDITKAKADIIALTTSTGNSETEISTLKV
jgi:hypothetical protein